MLFSFQVDILDLFIHGFNSFLIDLIFFYGPINYCLGWVLPHMKACKISDEIRRTEFFRRIYDIRISSFHLRPLHPWILIAILFGPHPLLVDKIVTGISMSWNENACQFCREALVQLPPSWSPHPPPLRVSTSHRQYRDARRVNPDRGQDQLPIKATPLK